MDKFENLDMALSQMSSKEADELFEKFCDSPNVEKSWYGEPNIVWEFVTDIASTYLGYSSGSDYFDDGQGTVNLMDMDLSDVDVSEEPTFDRYDFMSEIKEQFGNQLMDAVSTESLSTVSSFDEFYEMFVHNTTFEGSKEDFETLLKRSYVFSSMAFEIVTRYNG